MTFTVAITADAARADGSTIFGDIGLDQLSDAGVDWQVLPRDESPIAAEDLRGINAVLSLGHVVFDARTVDDADELLLIARFGAGYETINLSDCTRAGVAITNTPDAVRRPLALAALTLVLALAHQVPVKDRLVRSGRWGQRGAFQGRGVRGRVLGIVGFGNVGAELAGLASGIGFRVIGANRSGVSAAAERLGVPILPVDDLIRRSDYLVLTASLNSESRHLIDERRLRLMRPSAYLVNVARGGLVDEPALIAALQEGRLAGAALDVFEDEPLERTSPLTALENVILSPHSLPWTAEFTSDVSASARNAILAVSRGKTPSHLLNPEVLHSQAWRRKTRSLGLD